MFVRTETAMIDISNNHTRFVESPNIIKGFADGYKLFGIISYGKGYLVEAKYYQIHIILILDQSLSEIRRIENVIFKYIYDDQIIYHNISDGDDDFQVFDRLFSVVFNFRWTYTKNELFKSGKYRGDNHERLSEEINTKYVFMDVIYVCDHLLLLYKDRLEFYKNNRLIHTINEKFEGMFPDKLKIKLYKKDFTYEEFDFGILRKGITYINKFIDVIINV